MYNEDMLQLYTRLVGQAVLSLRIGKPVATVRAPIMNPRNLKIEGFYCEDHDGGGELVLLCQDVRELSRQGFIVNDQDVLVEAEDLVRLREVLDMNFQLIKKPVETVSGDKLGHVGDYAVETSSMYVQKLYVAPPIWKSLTEGSLSVDRTQIQEVTQKKVVIADPLQPVSDAAPVMA